MSGVLIVVVFLVIAAAMITRRLPAILAIPLLAVVIAAVAGVGAGGIAEIITKGAVQLAPVYATVILGAMLSRVVLSTGIAETIVAYAAEFGGDRPLVLALILCAAVAVLFTSVTGLGAIIMVGTIVLPVMLTVGVPRATAAALFLLAFALGYIVNIAQWTFYHQLFGVDRAQFGTYVLVLVGLQMAGIIGFVVWRARGARDYATSTVTAEVARARVHPLALVTPLIPLVLYAGFHIDALVAFCIAALYGVLVTRPRAIVATLSAAVIRGVEDVSAAVILMIGIGMLLVAAKSPLVQSAVTPIVSAVAPRSAVAYVITFGVLSPLALYRGPLNIFGVGIGVFSVLAALGTVPAVALVAAVMAVVQVQNACDPTNTQNVWVANFTGVGVDEILRLTLPVQVAVAIGATLWVALASGFLR